MLEGIGHSQRLPPESLRGYSVPTCEAFTLIMTLVIGAQRRANTAKLSPERVPSTIAMKRGATTIAYLLPMALLR